MDLHPQLTRIIIDWRLSILLFQGDWKGIESRFINIKLILKLTVYTSDIFLYCLANEMLYATLVN